MLILIKDYRAPVPSPYSTGGGMDQYPSCAEDIVIGFRKRGGSSTVPSLEGSYKLARCGFLLTQDGTKVSSGARREVTVVCGVYIGYD